MAEGSEIRFLVPSHSTQDGPRGGLRIEVASRGGGESALPVAAVCGRDIVRIELVNGPELFLHPETARDLMLSQHAESGASRSAAAASNPGAVRVPAHLQWLGSQKMGRARGTADTGVQAVLGAFEILKAPPETLASKVVVEAAASAVDHLVAPGLYRLTADIATLTGAPIELKPEPARTGKPALVLVHGTFSTLAGTFRNLWVTHPELVRRLLEAYPEGVYGFQHPTLQDSPLDNALALANALPKGVPIHFLTHSRGGLVAEALAKLSDPNGTIDPAGLALFDSAQHTPAQKTAYDRQKALLEEISRVARNTIEVQRVVRVACPARGTLLASGRLDAYLSVLKWGLKLARVPVAPAVVQLLMAVAKQRTDPQVLPGLEAMMPESPFLRWLHHDGDHAIRGDLRVVAGELQGDSIGSWVKTLLADAYDWTDNDLLVQTRSMFGGAPRVGGATFLLDRGGKVTHFNYFSNPQTASAVVNALLESAPTGFGPIGPQSSAGLSSTGVRSAVRDANAAAKSPSRPAVVVLPGLLGTHLKVGDKRVWLSPFILNGLEALAYRAPDDVVQPDGLLGLYYDGLTEYLSESHEVIQFPFDWRKPIMQEAQRLADVLTDAREQRRDSKQPVRLLAHSMGGLVVRALQLAAPDVWAAIMGHPNARFVMLGAPNGGSWVPMQVLSGDNCMGALLTAVGTLFDEVKARGIFAGLPGFLQLQAGMLDQTAQLWRQESWETLAANDRLRLDDGQAVELAWYQLALQKEVANWGIPTAAILEEARAFHQALADQDLSVWNERILMVVGSAERTPSGYETSQKGGFDYLQSDGGDGTVTMASARLPGVRAWQVEAEHGHLAQHRDLYPGYVELLERGTTRSQEFTPLSVGRGAAQEAQGRHLERMPRTARFRGWTADALDAVEGTLNPSDDSSTATSKVTTPAIRVSVVNGDLTFVKEPLLLGHYRSLALTGAEGVIDQFLGGTMSEALRLRRYPTLTGESEVFQNQQPNLEDRLAIPRPAAVIVVGLGPEGELRAEELARSVRQGVIAYAQRLAEDPKGPSSFALACTLAGSGGLGVSVGSSALAMVQGVRAANERLLKEGWPIVARLRFVELYEDRATEALRELIANAERLPAAFFVERVLEMSHGGLPRPDTPGYRGANYDYVSAISGPHEEGRATIAFTVDTRRARTEVRSSTAQLALVQDLIKDAEADRRSDAKLGKTLFRMLVPAELDAFFGDSESVVLEVDDETAPIPWEILGVDHDEDQPSERPWAIRAKLLRKLRSPRFRENPRPAGVQGGMLVFGDPDCDRNQFPILEGARREARAVAKVLGLEKAILEAPARAMVNALLERPYTIIHIAGHGHEDGSGVVMSDGQVMGAELVGSMRRVPDLVFVNCCHSGRQLLGDTCSGRPARAATIASALIRLGVRCVIAAGWAVDDAAAERFAEVFYDSLRKRHSFINATSRARETIWREFRDSNTWAAYQCYGDPDWILVEPGDRMDSDSKTPRPEASAGVEPLIVSSGTLRVTLKSLVSRKGNTDASKAAAGHRLDDLERAHAERFGGQGDVAEAFAIAHADLGNLDQAITWYHRAVEAEKGGASFKSLEQVSNLIARRAAEQVEAAHQQPDFDDVVVVARTAIDRAEKDLRALTAIARTYDRLFLLASVAKRRAMIEQTVCRVRPRPEATAQWKKAVRATAEAFGRAESLARHQARDSLHHSMLNRMMAEQLLRIPRKSAIKDSDVDDVKTSLGNLEAHQTDFWDLVAAPELAIYRALCENNLKKAAEEIARELTTLHDRFDRRMTWAAVRDQARFLLVPYRDATKNTAERQGATTLIELLEAFAGGGVT